jgi:hypothetical protein
VGRVSEIDRADGTVGGLIDVGIGLVAPAVHQLVGGARIVGRMTQRALVSVSELPLPLPPGVPKPAPAVQMLMRRGRAERAQLTTAAGDAATVVVPRVVTAMGKRLDLTALVVDNVDVDALAASIDVNAILARVDLLGLANYIITGVDLPEIIRESTAGITSEAVHGVRLRGVEADQAVARVIDRMLLRRHVRAAGGPNGSVDITIPEQDSAGP